LTRERFLPDRFHPQGGSRIYRTGDLMRRRGTDALEFLGRIDHQVKLRGLRIELGEIEATLQRQAGVKDAAAAIFGAERGEGVLCAFVVADGEGAREPEPWIRDLRARLRAALPHYMVPGPMVVVDALPRTLNGKLDRRSLIKPTGSDDGRDAEAPTTHLERSLTSMIADLLGGASIGRHDDIFSQGFHSLMAVRLVARIAQSLRIRLPIRAIFDAPTVAELALLCNQPGRLEALSPTSEPILTLNGGGTRTPFIYFHSDVLTDGMYCRRLATAVGSDQPLLAISPHGTAGLPLELTVEAMARDFLPRIRRLQQHGPYRLGGFCASGLVAYEVARLLRAEGEAVEQAILINTPAPSPDRSPIADTLVRAIGTADRLDPNLRESVCYNITRLAQAMHAGPRGIPSFLQERLRALFRRAERGRLKAAEFEQFERKRGTAATETYLAHTVSALTFHPQPYHGEVTIIWGVDQRFVADDLAGRWLRLADTVEIVPIAGGHVSPLHDQIDEFGRVLARLLA
jgi:thioesterase domain-containing protein/acyl carrier protein